MKLYTRNNCSACKNVKEALHRRGDAFQEINIEEDYDAAVRLVGQGYRAVPVLNTGETWLTGSALYEFVR